MAQRYRISSSQTSILGDHDYSDEAGITVVVIENLRALGIIIEKVQKFSNNH